MDMDIAVCLWFFAFSLPYWALVVHPRSHP
jgi:hypothetical protein